MNDTTIELAPRREVEVALGLVDRLLARIESHPAWVAYAATTADAAERVRHARHLTTELRARLDQPRADLRRQLDEAATAFDALARMLVRVEGHTVRRPLPSERRA